MASSNPNKRLCDDLSDGGDDTSRSTEHGSGLAMGRRRYEHGRTKRQRKRQQAEGQGHGVRGDVPELVHGDSAANSDAPAEGQRGERLEHVPQHGVATVDILAVPQNALVYAQQWQVVVEPAVEIQMLRDRASQYDDDRRYFSDRLQIVRMSYDILTLAYNETNQYLVAAQTSNVALIQQQDRQMRGLVHVANPGMRNMNQQLRINKDVRADEVKVETKTVRDELEE
ncbi:hypothetical protein LTR10_002205 [Elasticomyces elasticus]|uniref:Uncharacterized protein n=1 Tax=Elasticomyces elasticus TaxID=574655 RepID=A0AAN7WDE9_9PEZI|nr:hypothetical protein LTR10_002205 [Elasticomyces elasticus]KAK4973721.1 hypothetical protein LTR42_005710 [Elasticomyces elasticus]KAK5707831.1 hypothetical protein LTR97_000369 [Elasticomyces elasticus]